MSIRDYFNKWGFDHGSLEPVQPSRASWQEAADLIKAAMEKLAPPEVSEIKVYPHDVYTSGNPYRISVSWKENGALKVYDDREKREWLEKALEEADNEYVPITRPLNF